MDQDITQHPQSGKQSNILMIKGRLKATTSSLFGQFYIIFNNNKTINTMSSVISNYSGVYDMEPHADWTEYEKNIADWKWKGEFNSSMTTSIDNEFMKLQEETSNIQLLYDSVYNYDYDNMDIILYDTINRIIHDKSLVIENAIQEVTHEEYNSAHDEQKKEPEPEEPQQDEPEKKKAVLLPIKAVLAPVKGKPIYELKIGDLIMIKIQAISDQARYYIDLMDLKDDEQVIAAPAKVVDIKMGSGKKDPVQILVQIAPGVFGKITEDEQQMKLKVPDSSDGKSTGRGTAQGEKKGSTRGILVMIILVVLIIGLFGLLIIMGW